MSQHYHNAVRPSPVMCLSLNRLLDLSMTHHAIIGCRCWQARSDGRTNISPSGRTCFCVKTIKSAHHTAWSGTVLVAWASPSLIFTSSQIPLLIALPKRYGGRDDGCIYSKSAWLQVIIGACDSQRTWYCWLRFGDEDNKRFISVLLVIDVSSHL